MIEEKVKNYPDLVKVDKAFFVNSDKSAYAKALVRKKQKNHIHNLESRINSIEAKLDAIIKKLGET